MLFNVKVVTPDQYQAHIDELRQTNQGQLPTQLGRSALTPAENKYGSQDGSVTQPLSPEGQASKSKNGPG